MAKENEAARQHEGVGHNSQWTAQQWQDFIEGRVQASMMEFAPQMAQQFGLKLTKPTKLDRAKQIGFIIGVAAVGGAIGAAGALYIKGRRDAKLASAGEPERELNGHSRVRPVGGRAAALVS